VITFGGRPNTLQLAIRGISENDPTQLAAERPIAVYVDGVYIARGNGMDTEIFDIERMEILRGPQGTLFGRNAEGGALNITTRKPKGEFGFKQELEASDLDEYKSRTVIDTPEWNGLAASLAYLHREANGWINNPGGTEDFNWQDKNAYRLALQYNVGDVVVDYAYDNSDTDYMHNLNVLVRKPATSINPEPAGYYRRDNSFVGTLGPIQNTRNRGHSLGVEWNIDDALTFRSITGYRNLNDDNMSTGTGAQAFVPGPAFGLPATTAMTDSNGFAKAKQSQWSQEFQLIGEADRLDWQVGALYFHEEGNNVAASRFGAMYTGCTPGVYGATCGVATPIPYSGVLPANRTQTEVDTDSYGIYAQGTWTPNILEDRLAVTLGLRYGRDEKDIHRAWQTGAAVDVGTVATSERVDPALTVAYELMDDTSVYLRYSTAYRGGGVSVRQIQSFTPYEEEELESVELGLKSQFWDNRARLNAAAFYTEVDGLQLPVQQICFVPGTTIPLCGSSSTIIFNVEGTSRLSGFEMDASVLVMDGLTLSLDYNYLDNSLPMVRDGNNLRQPALSSAPRHSWAVKLDYDFEPFSFGQLNAHIDVTDSSEYCFNVFSCYEDQVLIAANTKPVHGGDDNRLVNARLTLSDIPVSNYGTLEAALWAKNLTDEEYLNFGYVIAGSSASIGHYGDPRSVGVTLTYQY
jgi:iron complex outermembrane receptor protein